MEDKELYQGISPEKRALWDREIEERFGDCGGEALQQSRARIAQMTPEEMASFKAEVGQLHEDMALLLDKGAKPDSDEAQAVAVRHYRWVCKSWTPDAAAYQGLGLFYVENSDFRTMFERIRPGLAEYFADAMAVYARRSL